MKLKLKKHGDLTMKVHDVPIPRPIHYANGDVGLIITTHEGVATIVLSRAESDDLKRYLP